MTTAKPARLLTSGAVHVWRVTETRVDAEVQGDTGPRRVVRDPGGWSCDCPSFTYRRTCSHIDATALVTTARSRNGDRGQPSHTAGRPGGDPG